MKHFLLSLVMLLTAATAVRAEEVVEIDGIYYNLNFKSKVAEVTQKPNGYSGFWEIPASIVYGGEVYPVTAIGDMAFSDCRNLTSVTIPNSVSSIGASAFRVCMSLVSIDIPNSVTSIGRYAFCNCNNLKTITIPNSVTTIGEGAFEYCFALASVTIPTSMTVINPHTFSGCTSLKSVTLPNSVTYIGMGAFTSCSSLTSISIPSNVKLITDHTFSSCSSLKQVTIPNGVTSIGINSFGYCSNLTSVIIPSTVERIGSKEFTNCKELTDVYCLAEKVPAMKNDWNNNVTDAFDGSNIDDVILYVPVASVNLYKEVEPWKSFKAIVGVEEGVKKCATPAITLVDGRLKFSCETEGVEYAYEITNSDVKKGYTDEVALTGTYKVSVYAMKEGYDNSDVATMEFSYGSNGEVCDVNRDGTVDVADIATIIDRMAGKARLQKEIR